MCKSVIMRRNRLVMSPRRAVITTVPEAEQTTLTSSVVSDVPSRRSGITIAKSTYNTIISIAPPPSKEGLMFDYNIEQPDDVSLYSDLAMFDVAITDRYYRAEPVIWIGAVSMLTDTKYSSIVDYATVEGYTHLAVTRTRDDPPIGTIITHANISPAYTGNKVIFLDKSSAKEVIELLIIDGYICMKPRLVDRCEATEIIGRFRSISQNKSGYYHMYECPKRTVEVIPQQSCVITRPV